MIKTNLKGMLIVPPGVLELSEVNHLEKSQKYRVEVKKADETEYTECFVYETDNYAGNYFDTEHKCQETAAFTSFSFGETAVDVKITCSFPIQTVKIRPLNFEVEYTVEGSIISFTLNEPKKLSVEVNDRLNPLFIFSDEPDVPDLNATYYYGPGVHHIGMRKLIRSGESVYIAGGAIVQGTFKVEDGASDVSIRGRGIINVGVSKLETNNCAWLSKRCTISAKENNNLSLEGLILTNAAAWTVSVTDSRGWNMPLAINKKGKNSYNNSYKNLKLISWNGCTDGLWFDGDYAVIDDCFIFNNDDGVTTHGSKHCRISNVTYWGGPFGRFFMHSNWASSQDLIFENINILGKEMHELILLGNARRKSKHKIKDVTFKNVRIEEHEGVFININAENLGIENMVFENVTIDKSNEHEGSIYCSESGKIENLSFTNLKIDGKYALSASDAKLDTDCEIKFIVR